MQWSMLWDLSVHNMSLPFDDTCCLCKSDIWKRVCVFLRQKTLIERLRSESSFLFPLLPTVQFDVVHQHLDLRHKQHTNSCRQHYPESSCSCFSLLVGFFGFILTLGISASKGSSSSSFSISTSARDSPTGSMSSPSGATSRFRVSAGLTSALLCHHRFPTADSSLEDNDQHRSHCWSLSISLLESDRN